MKAARRSTSGARKSIAGVLLVEADPLPPHCNSTGKEVAMGQIVKVGTVPDFEDAEGGKLVNAGGRL